MIRLEDACLDSPAGVALLAALDLRPAVAASTKGVWRLLALEDRLEPLDVGLDLASDHDSKEGPHEPQWSGRL